MKNLSNKEQTAIFNFIASMDLDMSKWEHTANALLDARLYGWSAAMVKELRKRIEKMYKGRV